MLPRCLQASCGIVCPRATLRGSDIAFHEELRVRWTMIGLYLVSALMFAVALSDLALSWSAPQGTKEIVAQKSASG